jgi:Protein of unknown function (DUF1761)
MAFAGYNLWAILAAGLAGYAFGALWYMALAGPWMAASGRTRADMAGRDGQGRSPLPFILALIANLVIAVVLAGLVGHLGPGQVTLRNGVISALFIGLGFVVPTMVVNNAFGGRPFALSLIDSGHWLGVLLIQGAIIGGFGV